VKLEGRLALLQKVERHPAHEENARCAFSVRVNSDPVLKKNAAKS
jgi:hypothetical protein